MVLDVAGRLKTSAIAGARWRAERITRTELANALNLGHQSALVAASEEDRGLQKQWDATLDSRTCITCTELHGQVVDIRTPWNHAGTEMMRPPGHVRCRCRLVPFKAAWAEAPEAGREGESVASSRLEHF